MCLTSQNDTMISNCLLNGLISNCLLNGLCSKIFWLIPGLYSYAFLHAVHHALLHKIKALSYIFRLIKILQKSCQLFDISWHRTSNGQLPVTANVIFHQHACVFFGILSDDIFKLLHLRLASIENISFWAYISYALCSKRK